MHTYFDPRVETLAFRVFKVGLGLEDDLVQMSGREFGTFAPHFLSVAIGPELHAPAVGVSDPVCFRLSVGQVSDLLSAVLVPLRKSVKLPASRYVEAHLLELNCYASSGSSNG